MGSLNTFINMIALGFGVYCLYVVWKLGVENKLFANSLLIPKDRTEKECLDQEGYIRHIKPRTVVLGVVLILEGLFGMADEYLNLVGRLFGEPSGMMRVLVLEIPVMVTLAVIIWYSVVLVKAQKMYWT